MIVCALLPRFALSVAADRAETMAAGPMALAPEAGREQRVGEVSSAAEAHGVRAGMALGEALARCPHLALLAPDPVGVAERWEGVLRALESLGAAVESSHHGTAAFAARGLLGLHDHRLEALLAAVRRAVGASVRLGVAPTRFCAHAAARSARARRPVVVGGSAAAVRAHLAEVPVDLLAVRAATAPLLAPLERLGIRTLGELAELPRGAMADRFGAAGVLAHRLACGEDDPLVPRRRDERLHESIELPESASGPQLERALELLLDRLLARPERRGRTVRAMTLAARLAEGGTWRERVVFREALSEPGRMRLALSGRLVALPSPAESLGLSAEGLGPPAAEQRALLTQATAVRRARLGEAVRQARTAAGPEAALRVLCVDSASRIPERRALLAPFEA